MEKELGSGIARNQSMIESPPPSYIRVAYTPSEEGLRIMKSLGYAIQINESRTVDAALEDNQVAFYRGEVWTKENGTSKSLLNPSEIHNLQDFIKKNGRKASLRSLEFENTKKLIMVLTQEDQPNHQVWLARNPGDAQVLEDGLFCLHFKQPAVDSLGNGLDQTQIAAVVENVGIMLPITHKGKILIPEIA